MKITKWFGSIMMALIAAMLILPAAATANSIGEDSMTTPKGEIRAGLTPDSPLHIFERSFERIRLAFTADPEKRTEKALEIARERLMEAKKMAEKGNAKAAGRAQKGHEQMMEKIEDSARKISDDNSRTRLERQIEIENELEEHMMEIESVESLVKSRANIRMDNSDSVEAINLLSKFRAKTESTKAEIERERGNTIVKLKLETGQSDNDIMQVVRSIEDRARSGSSERRGREVELEDDSADRLSEDDNKIQARVFDDFTRIKVEIDFSTSSKDRNAILSEMLSRAKLSKEEIDRLLDLRAAEDTEAPRERLRTEAKLRDEATETEFKLEFPVNIKDREAIVNAIFNKLNSLNIGDLDAAMRVDDRRGIDDDENELIDRRRGADKPEDNNDEDELFDRRRGADKPEDNNDEDASGQEAEARGREAEGEAPRGADSSSDDDSTPGSRGGSGRGGSSSDD